MNDFHRLYFVARVVMAPKPPWTDRIGSVGRVVAVYPSSLKPSCDGLDLEFADGMVLMFAREDLHGPVDAILAQRIAELESDVRIAKQDAETALALAEKLEAERADLRRLQAENAEPSATSQAQPDAETAQTRLDWYSQWDDLLEPPWHGK